MESIEDINKRLVERFGKSVSLDNPKYRVINTAGLTELRYGTFEDYAGDTYLRTVTEVREVPKYPFYENHWVLEALQGNDNNTELVTKISYEPIWVFGAANSDPNPIWKAVELLVHTHLFARSKNTLTLKDIDAAELRQYIKEKALFKDILQNDSPYIAGAIHDGAAVVVPHNYKKVEDVSN